MTTSMGKWKEMMLKKWIGAEQGSLKHHAKEEDMVPWLQTLGVRMSACLSGSICTLRVFKPPNLASFRALSLRCPLWSVMFLARVMSILRWQGSEEVAAKMSKSWLSCQAAWGLRHVACPHLYFHHACTPASNKRVLSSGFIVSAQKRRHSHSLARRAVASAPVPALRCHSCPASWHGALAPCYLRLCAVAF